MKRFYSLLIMIAFLFCACKKADLNAHKSIESDGSLPGAVTNMQVTNLPGAATITYKLPNDGKRSASPDCNSGTA